MIVAGGRVTLEMDRDLLGCILRGIRPEVHDRTIGSENLVSDCVGVATVSFVVGSDIQEDGEAGG